MLGPIVIDVRDLRKNFVQPAVPVRLLQDRLLRPYLLQNCRDIEAVKEMSLSVRKGEWVGVYGPNGSGKSTLLKMIAGLLQPDSGTIVTHGTLSSFFGLGIGFNAECRADENIYLHGLLWGLRRSEIRAMTKRIIEFAGVASHAHLPIKCYSTGMALRLAYAAVTEIDADIYLFDEILAVGDIEFQRKCHAHFAALKAKGKTVMLVSHSYRALKKFCDRLVYFDHGNMTDAPPEGMPLLFDTAPPL